MRHLDLFSGIGGFALAASNIWGEQYVPAGFCEIDRFCREILKLRFPGVEIHDDVKTFDGEKYAEEIDLLTGGFPCQPFSTAGRNRGVEDSRWLWPEMFRIIRSVSPRWVVAENSYGIASRSHELVFEGICSDLESVGYEIQPIAVPACAVGAPHQRQRVWFIGYAERVRSHSSEGGEGAGERGESTSGADEAAEPARSIGGWRGGTAPDPKGIGRRMGSSGDERATVGEIDASGDAVEGFVASDSESVGRGQGESLAGRVSARTGASRDEWAGLAYDDSFSADSESEGLEGHEPARSRRSGGRASERTWRFPGWDERWPAVATRLCGVDDGVPAGVDGFELSKVGHRRERIKALGNAIVPQIVQKIFEAIKLVENRNDKPTSEE